MAIAGLKHEIGHVHLHFLVCLLIFMSLYFMNVSDILEIIERDD